jgi:hypothetical protein
VDNQKLEFQYGLYIGKHMEGNPLRVKYLSSDYDFLSINTNPSKNDLACDASYNGEYKEVLLPIDDCKPQLKSLENLTDEEWLFVFGCKKDSEWKYRIEISDGFINLCDRYGNRWNYFSVITNRFNYSDQDTFNRLHSLHRSENEKALLEAGLVEVVDG